MLKHYWPLLLASMLTACVSAPTSKFGPVSTSTKSELLGLDPVFVEVAAGKGLSHTTAAETAMMASGMMFGAIGGAIGAGAAIKSANHRGAALTQGDSLTDPSLSVAAGLKARLVAAGHSYSDNASLRLQLTTTNWALSKDTLAYFVTLQITDMPDKVTKGECKYFRKTSELGTTTDALLADSGAGLKAEYAKASDYCVSYFSGELLAGR